MWLAPFASPSSSVPARPSLRSSPTTATVISQSCSIRTSCVRRSSPCRNGWRSVPRSTCRSRMCETASDEISNSEWICLFAHRHLLGLPLEFRQPACRSQANELSIRTRARLGLDEVVIVLDGLHTEIEGQGDLLGG